MANDTQEEKPALLSLQEYEVIANKMIGSLRPWLSRTIFVDNDLYTDAINTIMMADWQFNGKGTLFGYRKYRFNCFIKSHFSKFKKKQEEPKHVALMDGIAENSKDYRVEIQEYLGLLDNPKDREVLEQKYLKRMTLAEIAKESNVSYEAVRLRILSALQKVQKINNNVKNNKQEDE
jgi:RNA polymerase sigma factor (sigma-70 family)